MTNTVPMKFTLFALAILFGNIAASFENDMRLMCTYNERIEYRDLKNHTAYDLGDEGMGTQMVIFEIQSTKLEIVNSTPFSLIDPWGGLKIVKLTDKLLVSASENNFLRLIVDYNNEIVGYGGYITDQITAFELRCIEN